MGKSTLARILAGIQRPASGTLRLDNAELFAWPRASVGEVVGYLAHEVELPDDTMVGAVIARGGDATKVWTVGGLAGRRLSRNDPSPTAGLRDADRARRCAPVRRPTPTGGSGACRSASRALLCWTSPARISTSRGAAGWWRRSAISGRAPRRSWWSPTTLPWPGCKRVLILRGGESELHARSADQPTNQRVAS